MINPDTRILVLGAQGMLGSELCSALSWLCHLTAWDIDDLDITDRESVLSAISELMPHEVVNCAAYTDVDGCESNEEEATAVNAIAPGYIAEACLRTGARLTHISSEYIFDGRSETDYTEGDRPNPLSVYGRGKLSGELEVSATGCRYAIIRTQWLYGAGGRNFVDTIITKASERPKLKVVDDQIGRPTWSNELALAITEFLRNDSPGVYHLAAGGTCSWYDVAIEIARLKNLPACIEPVPTSQFPRPAPRPARAVLDCSFIKQKLGIEMRHWKEALADYLG